MPKDYSPFTPGQPVPLEFFVGRLAEVEKLIHAVKAATEGNLRVLFLTGERGIGKSSLAAFVRFIAERDHLVLGLHTFLGGVSTLEEMVRRVFDRLLKESTGKTWHEKIRQFFGNHIRQVGLFGVSVEFSGGEQELNRFVADFLPALRNLMDKLKDEKKAIFLVLDDINGLAESEKFANWVKSLVDEIATSFKPLPLCLILVGLEERRQSLIAHQPSLARVFDIIEIKIWSPQETEDFFRRTFSKVNIEVTKEAMELLCNFAGGFPVLAHEIGDATFQIDTDGKIDLNDAAKGIEVAADVVGRKHLEPQVFQAIRSAKYRKILRKIAQKPFEIAFTSRDIRPRLTAEENKVFHNFLRRMRQLGVLQKDPEQGRGAYRFANRLHYLYFWLEALRAKKPQPPH